MNNIVSVVMTVFNSEKFVENSIKSVLSQSERNFEFIIVNDSSTDRSLDIIRKYEKSDNRIKLVNLKKNVGPAEGRNIAIRNSNSNLIFNLDSDDLMLPDRLHHQKKFFDLNPEAAVVGCLGEYIDEKGNIFGKTHVSFYTKSDFENLIKKKKNIGMLSSGICFKKDIFYKIGGFNKEHPYCEDLDLWNRFAENGYLILIQKRILVQYRIHKESIITANFISSEHYKDWLKKCRFNKKENLKDQTFEEYKNDFNNQNIFLKANKMRKIYAKKNLREMLQNMFSRNFISLLKNIILLVLLSPNVAFKTFLRFMDYKKDKIQK